MSIELILHMKPISISNEQRMDHLLQHISISVYTYLYQSMLQQIPGIYVSPILNFSLSASLKSRVLFGINICTASLLRNKVLSIIYNAQNSWNYQITNKRFTIILCLCLVSKTWLFNRVKLFLFSLQICTHPIAII